MAKQAVKLTKLEEEVLRAIPKGDEYGGFKMTTMGAKHFAKGFDNPASVRAVVNSLGRKGIVEIGGKGEHQFFKLTTIGKEWLVANKVVDVEGFWIDHEAVAEANRQKHLAEMEAIRRAVQPRLEGILAVAEELEELGFRISEEERIQSELMAVEGGWGFSEVRVGTLDERSEDTLRASVVVNKDWQMEIEITWSNQRLNSRKMSWLNKVQSVVEKFNSETYTCESEVAE